jgi:hypothetical protein
MTRAINQHGSDISNSSSHTRSTTITRSNRKAKSGLPQTSAVFSFQPRMSARMKLARSRQSDDLLRMDQNVAITLEQVSAETVSISDLFAELHNWHCAADLVEPLRRETFQPPRLCHQRSP